MQLALKGLATPFHWQDHLRSQYPEGSLLDAKSTPTCCPQTILPLQAQLASFPLG